MKIEHEAITDVKAVEKYYGEQDGAPSDTFALLSPNTVDIPR